VIDNRTVNLLTVLASDTRREKFLFGRGAVRDAEASREEDQTNGRQPATARKVLEVRAKELFLFGGSRLCTRI